MTEESPSEKLKIETLLKLAELSWKSMDQRRAYEWKVNLALWPALALFAGAQLRGDILHVTNGAYPWIVLFCLLTILAVYVFLWSAGMHKRQGDDIGDAHEYLNLVESEIKLPLVTRRCQRSKDFKKQSMWENWSRSTQMAITGLLVILAASIAFLAANANEQSRSAAPSSIIYMNEIQKPNSSDLGSDASNSHISGSKESSPKHAKNTRR
jgi:hypothetical protein